MKGYTIDYYLSLTDSERNREMYALFGKCVFNFQLLEHQLMNMILVYYKSSNIILEEKEYNTLFADYSDKTMGKLIEKVISIFSLDKNVKEALWQIHRKRNFFVHHYFKNRNKKLFNVNGEIEIINEINEVDNLVIDMDKYLTHITKPLIETIGITEEHIKGGVEKMKKGEFVDELEFPE
jgi:hypothetical protein